MISAPPLPDAFGNYALGDFVEVVAPSGISWLPQTPGWLIVAAIVAWYAGRWTWRRLEHWYQNRYRKEALQRLSQLPSTEHWLADVNELLKITAVTAYGRPATARLNGEPWPRFLNEHCEPAPFSPELSKLLAEGSYRPIPIETGLRNELLKASAQWIRCHHEATQGA